MCPMWRGIGEHKRNAHVKLEKYIIPLFYNSHLLWHVFLSRGKPSNKCTDLWQPATNNGHGSTMWSNLCRSLLPCEASPNPPEEPGLIHIWITSPGTPDSFQELADRTWWKDAASKISTPVEGWWQCWWWPTATNIFGLFTWKWTYCIPQQ